MQFVARENWPMQFITPRQETSPVALKPNPRATIRFHWYHLFFFSIRPQMVLVVNYFFKLAWLVHILDPVKRLRVRRSHRL